VEDGSEGGMEEGGGRRESTKWASLALPAQVVGSTEFLFIVVGRTWSLHYYYLAFVLVLTYLAYLIGVNTSYISSLGTTDPGIRALVALDWLFGESEKHSLSPSIHQ
jgi:hypothetical protein